MIDVTPTLAPKSDQLNADEFGPDERRVITVTRVKMDRGADQPLSIFHEGEQRAYKPSKGMRRVLVHFWGSDAAQWAGKRIELYKDPTVKFGSAAVGGIRIGGLSDIDGDATVQVTVTRGKKKPHRVRKLGSAPKSEGYGRSIEERRAEARAHWESNGVELGKLEEKLGLVFAEWQLADCERLVTLWNDGWRGEQ
jgi:hypothetical protein